jgi:hypothetical protein
MDGRFTKNSQSAEIHFFSVLVAKFHVINLYAADRKSILYIY